MILWVSWTQKVGRVKPVVFLFTPKTMDSDSAPCVSQWMLLSKVDLARILDSLSSAGSPNNKNSFQKMEVKRKNFKHSTPSTLVSFRIGSFSTFMIMGGRVPFDYQVHFSQHECFWVVKCADFSVILDTIGILKGCSHLTWDVENPVNTGTNYRSLNWRSPDFWTINGCWTSFFFQNPGRPNWTMLYYMKKESCKVKDIHIFYIWSRYNKHMIIDRCVYRKHNHISSHYPLHFLH